MPIKGKRGSQTSPKKVRRSRRLQDANGDPGPNRMSKKHIIKELTSYHSKLVEWLKKDRGYIDKSVEELIIRSSDQVRSKKARPVKLDKSTQKALQTQLNDLMESHTDAEVGRQAEIDTLTNNFQRELKEMLQRHSLQRIAEENKRARKLKQFVLTRAIKEKVTSNGQRDEAEDATAIDEAEDATAIDEAEDANAIDEAEDATAIDEAEDATAKEGRDVSEWDSFLVAKKHASSFSKYAGNKNLNALESLARSQNAPVWGSVSTSENALKKSDRQGVDTFNNNQPSNDSNLKTKSKRLFSYSIADFNGSDSDTDNSNNESTDSEQGDTGSDDESCNETLSIDELDTEYDTMDSDVTAR
ncbi:hypothetical protein KGF57_002374 [Candida theae]|uniref:Uncharacterized protein n=1 Tax=Candida theae TaxID=1198502 RepID=A0AAD5BF65_9ASCO|nr:uncharacterized protein KGF57_002374 [Candida theae]KAI5958529.1 hypothetical protein KGF57_002374 [Candida theae]